MNTKQNKYRLKTTNQIIVLFIFVILSSISIIPGYVMIEFWRDGVNRLEISSTSLDKFFGIFDLLFSVVFFFIFLLSIIIIIFFIYNFLKKNMSNFVEVSPEGIECDFWPAYRVKCKWKDFDKLYRTKILVPVDQLIFRNGEIQYGCIRTLQRKFIKLPPVYSIQISEFNGWPNGDLAKDIELYIPQALTG